MSALFGPRLLGAPELFGRNQNVGKLAGIRRSRAPTAKPVFGVDLVASVG